MKNEFREFYFKEILNFENLDDSVLVVLDTNVLLHIFRFSIDSRKKLISSLKKVKSNLWIPYQVGLEYNLHKVNLISKMRDSEENLKEEVDKEIKNFKSVIFSKIDEIGIKSSDEKVIRKAIKDDFEKKLIDMTNQWKSEELIKEFKLIGNVDDESNQIAEIFEGKVGSQFNQEQIDAIEKDADQRYEIDYPPGYKDDNKGLRRRRYGDIIYHEKNSDLIIWKQIIEKVKHDEKINKVIFVTDDEKQDWQFINKGQKKGPRAELKKELIVEANADLFMFNTNNFLNKINDETGNIVDLDVLTNSEMNDKIKNYFYSDSKKFNDIIDVDSYTHQQAYNIKKEKNFNKRKQLAKNIRSFRSQYNKVLEAMESDRSELISENILIENLRTEMRINLNKLSKIYIVLGKSYLSMSEVERFELENDLDEIFGMLKNFYIEYLTIKQNNEDDDNDII